jgi:hypothetical protein
MVFILNTVKFTPDDIIEEYRVVEAGVEDFSEADDEQIISRVRNYCIEDEVLYDEKLAIKYAKNLFDVDNPIVLSLNREF